MEIFWVYDRAVVAPTYPVEAGIRTNVVPTQGIIKGNKWGDRSRHRPPTYLVLENSGQT